MVSSAATERRHVPGEPGVWILLFAEMALFSILFVSYLLQRADDPGLFELSQHALNEVNGIVNTFVLLSGSLLVVWALHALRHDSQPLAARLVLGAEGFGLLFILLKAFEYHHKFDHGLTPSSNDFFMWYYVLTGLHLAHLVVGMLMLSIVFRMARGPELSPGRFVFVEFAACYWHMVDLVWIVLFSLLYLAG